MELTAASIVSWLAPILSTVIVTAATAAINYQVQKSQRVADERHAETEAKRAVEAQWRDSVDERMSAQDERIETVLNLQCSQTRSDILHKCHRYIDDLHGASTEEKEALWAEHVDYKRVCEANGIENNFIEQMVLQVMELPNRTSERKAS